jgi:hypothetical protein
VFENRVWKRIFGPKRAEVAGGWRKLYNEEPHNLYASPNIIKVTMTRRIRWAWCMQGGDEKFIENFGPKICR